MGKENERIPARPIGRGPGHWQAHVNRSRGREMAPQSAVSRLGADPQRLESQGDLLFNLSELLLQLLAIARFHCGRK